MTLEQILEKKGIESIIYSGLYRCSYEIERGLLVIPCYTRTEDMEATLEYCKYIDSQNGNTGEYGIYNQVTQERLIPSLLGKHLCHVEDRRLYLCSNEWDCMTIQQVTNMKHNVVSVVTKLNDLRAISNNYEWLHQFEEIVIVQENTTKGNNWCLDIKNRLDLDKVNVKCIDAKAFNEFKTLNELYINLGEGKVEYALRQIVDIQIKGVVDLSTVDPSYVNELPKIFTMFNKLDERTGGILFGDVWLYTGLTGSGKTEFLTQLSLNAVEQCQGVCIYSGEIPKERYRASLNCKVVGSQYIKKVPRKLYGGIESQKYYDCYIDEHIHRQVNDWLKGRYFIYDTKDISKEDECKNILDIFIKAHKEYGCTFFVVDNLMTIMSNIKDKDIFYEQGVFVNNLINFANKYNVTVHLVAHPRKTLNAKLTNFDIAGSSNIANLAHTIISIHRLDDEEKHQLMEAGKKYGDHLISCTKNRATGETFSFYTYFNKTSKTFSDDLFEPGYSWNKYQQCEL